MCDRKRSTLKEKGREMRIQSQNERESEKGRRKKEMCEKEREWEKKGEEAEKNERKDTNLVRMVNWQRKKQMDLILRRESGNKFER